MPAIKVVKTDKFEKITKGHQEKMNSPEGEHEEYKSISKMLHFQTGKKLTLEVEITNEELSASLINLLYGRIEGQELLGFRINHIHLNKPTDKLNEVIDATIAQLQQLKQ